ncbi:MAG: hypothetical protein IJ856_00265 [Candidatus Methanomethylophilaceae archaeon]|nr:hypothetical protein [Candidatus Methanomethylophilaceae archaeon]
MSPINSDTFLRSQRKKRSVKPVPILNTNPSSSNLQSVLLTVGLPNIVPDAIPAMVLPPFSHMCLRTPTVCNRDTSA